MTDEVIQRLERMEEAQTMLTRDLHSHTAGEAVTVKLYGEKLDALSIDMNEIKTTLNGQKKFVAGMLFTVTAAGYVLVEGIKRMMGQ